MKKKTNKKLLKEIKEQMIRYHRLILPETKKVTKKLGDVEDFQKKSKKLKKVYDDVDSHDKLLKYMRDLRVKKIIFLT